MTRHNDMRNKEKKSDHKLFPQTDCLYVRSVLVTAGMNHNDDVFFVKELWNARHTPILKPMNWGHTDEIIGVMYNVFARDLATGEVIPDDLDEYDQPFELVTESVIYKLLFPQRAEEIIQKSQADELFVSMETWFDDYSYAVFKDDKIVRVIQRNTATAFLDEALKAHGGSGKFDFGDGEIGRIGRGLLTLCFGGCGFVPCPANDRSVIEAVGDDPETAEQDRNDKLLSLLNMLEAKESDVVSVNTDKEVEDMEKVIATKAEVKAAIEEHDAEKAAEKEMTALRAQADKAEALEAEVQKLRSAVDTINSKLDSMLQGFTDTMTVVTKTLAEASVSVGTPPEIKKIDEAETGEECFLAKIDWIEKSKAFLDDVIAALNAKALSADEMQKKLDEIAWAEKENDVKALLGDYVEEETMEKFLAQAKELDDEGFNSWLEEKKLLVDSVKAKTAKAEEGEVEDKVEAEEGAEQEPAEAEAQESTESEDNQAETTEEADEAVAEALETVEVENKPEISNASHEDEEEDPSGMKAVAAIVCRSVDNETENVEDKPGFDPVD